MCACSLSSGSRLSLFATLTAVCIVTACLHLIGMLDVLLPSRMKGLQTAEQDPSAWSRVGFIPPENTVRSYSNVCVEWSSEPRAAGFLGVNYQQLQRIVIYDTSEVNLTTNCSTTRNELGLSLEFVTATIPTSSHTLIAGSVAYFMTPSNPGNLHHFWVETFLQMFSVVNTTGRLHPAARNYLLYSQPYHLLPPGGLNENNVTRYENFYDSLYMNRTSRRVFWLMPNNTCFANAVFGYTFDKNLNERQVIEHVVRSLYRGSRKPQQQSHSTSRYVTIVQRRRRKLLNAEEMATAARNVGFGNVRVVMFDDLSVEEQMKVAVETCVLVGVNGAGLHWGIFMQPNASSVLEIGWPQLGFGYFYEFITKRYNIAHVKLSADMNAMRLNWNSYESLFGKTSSEQRAALLGKFPSDQHYNAWKWADIVVNIKQFIHVLAKCHC